MNVNLKYTQPKLFYGQEIQTKTHSFKPKRIVLSVVTQKPLIMVTLNPLVIMLVFALYLREWMNMEKLLLVMDLNMN